ncbi:hypothetical protein ACIP93_37385 [Streptomyces sp. NPDC088745]|uniref:hypothetical protein n=1 Tax=Streptomyces sp. NPDC088745 TaxID=3365884 RepID=UPI00380F7ECB
MIPILCGECGSYSARMRLTVEGLFQCDHCGWLLFRTEISLDGNEIWVVGPDGTLGYVIDPAVSLAEIAESLDDYMSAPHDSYGELEALRKSRDAASRLRAAYEAGVPYPKAEKK